MHEQAAVCKRNLIHTIKVCFIPTRLRAALNYGYSPSLSLTIE